jgi:hypothetical protein
MVAASDLNWPSREVVCDKRRRHAKTPPPAPSKALIRDEVSKYFAEAVLTNRILDWFGEERIDAVVALHRFPPLAVDSYLFAVQPELKVSEEIGRAHV